MVLDYITDIMCDIADKKLSSAVGFKGICRKVLIIALAGVGHLLDTQIFGEIGVLRTAVIFFYLSNEGLSLVENAAYLGLPIPGKLYKVLEQLHDRAEKENEKEGEVREGRFRLGKAEERDRMDFVGSCEECLRMTVGGD